MKKIALVSYNRFIRGENGWHEREGRKVFLLHETRDIQIQISEIKKLKPFVNPVVAKIEENWKELQTILPIIDQLVIYVGASGSERAIELAADSDFPLEKLTFVMCDCFLPEKINLLERKGFQSVRVLMCDCGGTQEMRKIFYNFLENGTLD
ncbi:hypothetical protein KKC32_00790 [Patescibacteria group bacterium]|nr:hypothetical protein [Patescibacteria group bacterium]